MLDGATYAMAQRLARSEMSTWQYANTHQVVFDYGIFPRNVQSYTELPQIIDTMQENRFDGFLTELGGLTDHEFDTLCDAAADSVLFQLQFFPSIRPKIPFNTMAACFALYQKLAAVKPDFKSVLEIGPGTGDLSFFLKNRSTLQNYSQVEACEGYYLLQSLVNSYCFPLRFREHAMVPANLSIANPFTVATAHIFSPPNYVDIDINPVCSHYPWWRLGDVAVQRDAYDIVTSNANLCEFSDLALHDYVKVILDTLHPTGFFVVQCFGGAVRRERLPVRKVLYEAGFAPLAYTPDGSAFDVRLPSGQRLHKGFMLGQGIFVKRGHPLFERAYRLPSDLSERVLMDEVATAYFSSATGKRPRTIGEAEQCVLQTVRARFASL